MKIWHQMTPKILGLLLGLGMIGSSGQGSASESETITPSSKYWPGFISTPIQAILVPDRPYKTWVVPKAPHPFYSVHATEQGALIYRCEMDRAHPGDLASICLIDFTEAAPVERLLFNPTDRVEQPVIKAIEGDWILYVTNFTKTFKLLNLRTGEQIFVGNVTHSPAQNPVGPIGSISALQLVWVDEVKDPKTGLRYIVKWFDITTRETKILFQAPPKHEIDQVALEGNRLVYSLTDVTKLLSHTGFVNGDVYLYDLATGRHTRLTKTHRASQPRIMWPYIVWKTGVNFGGGGVYLYNADTKQGQELVKADHSSFPSKNYDFPKISPAGVTWTGLMGDEKVVLYHPSAHSTEVLDPNGGLVSLAGYYMGWAGDTDKACKADPGHACLFFSDLSSPTPTVTK